MLARDYCTDPIKPVIVSHHMLLGLTGVKMSKSDPNSAIFMEDSAEDVVKKIKKAYCPPQEIYNEQGEISNPIVDYAKSIVLPALDYEWPVDIKCDGKVETVVYKDFAQLEKDYLSGKLYPNDLKAAVTIAINKLLQPVRSHFENDPYARNLLETIKRW